MSETLNSLQFETAEGITPGSVSCSVCSNALVGEYHELNSQAVCAPCRARAEAEYARDRQWTQFIVAAVYGFGAAILGGLLYWGFVKITNFELGLMAIAVGWLVGKAIMKGSNHRGGRRYQYLALALTYFSITISYGALIIGEVMSKPQKQDNAVISTPATTPNPAPQAQEQAAPVTSDKAESPAPNLASNSKPVTPAPKEEMSAGTAVLGLGFLFLILLASPFLAGFSNVIGWLIIAIGLHEAWKQVREVPFVTGGPYKIAPPAPPTLPEEQQQQADSDEVTE